jgi:adenosylhomocysteine nucleosidase
MTPRGSTLLIVAALAEELRPVVESHRLCEQEARRPFRTETRGPEEGIRFLKAGVGPDRAAGSLRRALEEGQARCVLITGYAGALDPALRVGDLLVAQRAILLSRDGEVVDTRAMDASQFLLERATEAGLGASRGEIVTSHVPVGDPKQKSLLFARFGAAAVDMETAALVRIATRLHVPVACVRVVTDEAMDTFPSSVPKFLRSSLWEGRTAIARQSLSAFFAAFFETDGPLHLT